ncbi:response regulator [Massilia sp. IC2-476]|uniref:response regulator n=1 Tax=Massilia sp. IC2-476 TaxID=2887199 RepID=UPI001D120BEB|nr:response regulator [Massilia sp. IC2-476]
MHSNPGKTTQPDADMPQRRRLLIVDDNADAATLLSMALKRQGHHVETAFSGTDALAAAIRFRPELVFLDLAMPRMNGFEVARRLRSLPSLRHTRIAALSGRADPDTRAATTAAGFDHHLAKPPNLAEILAVLAQGGPP